MNDNSLSSVGYLQVRTFLAEGGMPVPNVYVRVSGNEEYNIGVEYSVLTGRSGLTEKISLPAPPRSLSLSPGAAEQPYSTYDVYVSAEGYYPKKVFNIAVFSGILSVLPLSMVPDAGLIRNVEPPRSSNFSISQENEEL